MSPKITLAGREVDPVRGGLFVAVLGVAMAGFGAYDYAQQSTTIANTETVTATITETGVETVSQRRGRTGYEPTVTFEYEYRGESYTNDDLSPATLSASYDTRSAAEAALAEYESGAEVTAYVLPDSPGAAFLEDDVSTDPLKFVAIGGVIALLSGASIVRSRLRQ